MSHISPTATELQSVRNRISSLMRDASAREQELQGTLDIMASMSTVDDALIAGSSSSARKKRGKQPPAETEPYRKELEYKIFNTREQISSLWAKINELQEKERELEKQNQ